MVLLFAFLPLRGKIGIYEYPLQVIVLTAFLVIFSRKVIDFKTSHMMGSIAIGIAVFFLWIGPDVLFPDYRSHWLFTNSLMGEPGSTVAPEWRDNWMVLISRTIKAAVLVAIIEELFWRGWLMRWLIKPNFESVPLGTYAPQAFWITAVFFALEHGSYWEVGLLTGLIYGWWMIRTRTLGDLIIAHGVTNLLLSIYVIKFEQWQYWS